MNETVTISVEEYNELVEDQGFLDMLMAYGVQDWDGYQLAQEDYYQ